MQLCLRYIFVCFFIYFLLTLRIFYLDILQEFGSSSQKANCYHTSCGEAQYPFFFFFPSMFISYFRFDHLTSFEGLLFECICLYPICMFNCLSC